MNKAARKSGGNRWAKVTLTDRLLPKIEPGPMWRDGTRCWDWQGSANAKGYGSIYRDGKRIMVHQASYEEFVGPMPEGTEIDHLCRRPCCINPLHLEPVTRSENLRRGTGFVARHAAQTHCKRGHEFTLGNTYVSSRGERICRKCHAAKAWGYRNGMTTDEVIALREFNARFDDGNFNAGVVDVADKLSTYRLEDL